MLSSTFLDPAGRPSFQALHHLSTSGFSLVYYAFDLLHLAGRDLMRAPLEERRAALRDAVAGSGVLLSDTLPGTPRQIEAAVRRLQLEGVVAKRRRSRYEPGRRSDAWVKVRFAKHQELVIGGYKPNSSTFDSLLVGYYEGESTRRPAPTAAEHRGLHAGEDPRVGRGRRLLCAGKVRNGFTAHLRAAIFDRLRSIAINTCPFTNLPTTTSGHWGEGITAEEMHALRWVKPQLVAEIAFVEWTRDGSLRHATFLGLRDDKKAKDVQRE
jgi:bifunctional non-homologous end joining protein LigD